MKTRSLLFGFALLAMAPAARGDTVYPPGSNPLAVRERCVHWVTPLQVFVANDSLGERKYNLVFSQAGVSFRRNGPLRWPLVAVGAAEADQSQERFKDKIGLVVSGGFALRTGDWDNGRFEPQWVFLYTYDVTSRRHGATIGFAIGF